MGCTGLHEFIVLICNSYWSCYCTLLNINGFNSSSDILNEENRQTVAGWTIMFTCVGVFVHRYAASDLSLPRVRNRLGETPVYRAAALGKTKLLQILTEQFCDSSYHFHSGKDDKTILHMAILGQHFETAIWLLDQDSSLAEKRATLKSDELSSTSRKPPKSDEHIGFTFLELLALMPTAFTGADDMKKKASLFNPLIFSCLQTYLDDDCNYKEDLETDKIDNRFDPTRKRRGNGERAALICS
ncbi:hypothetical protein WN944_002013 [Citrus x changshan-huyou]|uniref:Uncharacterized protein n=1 Tax=Citrus x changshan-huyou TaxID=2935761 RepID=A0AAP0MM17_9ROSI